MATQILIGKVKGVANVSDSLAGTYIFDGKSAGSAAVTCLLKGGVILLSVTGDPDSPVAGPTGQASVSSALTVTINEPLIADESAHQTFGVATVTSTISTLSPAVPGIAPGDFIGDGNVDLEGFQEATIDLEANTVMARVDQNFQIFPGDDKQLDFTVRDSSGTVDISGASAISWAIRHGGGTLSKSLGSGIALLGGGTGGQLRVTITSGDSTDFVPGEARHELNLTLSGSVYTVSSGIAHIHESII